MSSGSKPDGNKKKVNSEKIEQTRYVNEIINIPTKEIPADVEDKIAKVKQILSSDKNEAEILKVLTDFKFNVEETVGYFIDKHPEDNEWKEVNSKKKKTESGQNSGQKKQVSGEKRPTQRNTQNRKSTNNNYGNKEDVKKRGTGDRKQNQRPYGVSTNTINTASTVNSSGNNSGGASVSTAPPPSQIQVPQNVSTLKTSTPSISVAPTATTPTTANVTTSSTSTTTKLETPSSNTITVPPLSVPSPTSYAATTKHSLKKPRHQPQVQAPSSPLPQSQPQSQPVQTQNTILQSSSHTSQSQSQPQIPPPAQSIAVNNNTNSNSPTTSSNNLNPVNTYDNASNNKSRQSYHTGSAKRQTQAWKQKDTSQTNISASTQENTITTSIAAPISNTKSTETVPQEAVILPRVASQSANVDNLNVQFGSLNMDLDFLNDKSANSNSDQTRDTKHPNKQDNDSRRANLHTQETQTEVDQQYSNPFAANSAAAMTFPTYLPAQPGFHMMPHFTPFEAEPDVLRMQRLYYDPNAYPNPNYTPPSPTIGDSPKFNVRNSGNIPANSSSSTVSFREKFNQQQSNGNNSNNGNNTDNQSSASGQQHSPQSTVQQAGGNLYTSNAPIVLPPFPSSAQAYQTPIYPYYLPANQYASYQGAQFPPHLRNMHMFKHNPSGYMNSAAYTNPPTTQTGAHYDDDYAKYVAQTPPSLFMQPQLNENQNPLLQANTDLPSPSTSAVTQKNQSHSRESSGTPSLYNIQSAQQHPNFAFHMQQPHHIQQSPQPQQHYQPRNQQQQYWQPN